MTTYREPQVGDIVEITVGQSIPASVMVGCSGRIVDAGEPRNRQVVVEFPGGDRQAFGWSEIIVRIPEEEQCPKSSTTT